MPDVAVAQVRADVVAMTDDDCEVPTDWLTTLTARLLRDERVALAYCSVVAGPHDPAAGVIPVFRCEGEVLVSTLREWVKNRGIGAGMAVRRSVILDIGGFETALPAYGDRDIAVRALCFGYRVFLTDAVAVVHHGFRTWAEFEGLTRRNWVGFGGGHAKFIKSGRPDLVGFWARELLTLVRVRGRGPHPWRLQAARTTAYVRAFTAGLMRRVDRKRLRYADDRPLVAQREAGCRSASASAAARSAGP